MVGCWVVLSWVSKLRVFRSIVPIDVIGMKSCLCHVLLSVLSLISFFFQYTLRSMRERIKEHDRDIRFARTQTSAVSEHVNETGHIPIWSKVKFIDCDPH